LPPLRRAHFGISYSFGSIFDDIANPRFGGVNFEF
jgi:hypothetical protein